MESDLRTVWSTTATYDLHKKLINQYFLCRPGATAQLQRDTSRDRTDYDVLRDNHQFLWEDDDAPTTWEAKLAKKYYDKLFKEYCICDLSRYEEKMVAMRWRTEKEVVSGKGQFSCAEKHCSATENLKTWEVNFAYLEKNEKKNALVKIRLCEDCSPKLNHRKKHREVKRKKRNSSEADSTSEPKKIKIEPQEEEKLDTPEVNREADSNIWKQPIQEKSREEEFEDYLNDLFL